MYKKTLDYIPTSWTIFNNRFPCCFSYDKIMSKPLNINMKLLLSKIIIIILIKTKYLLFKCNYTKILRKSYLKLNSQKLLFLELLIYSLSCKKNFNLRDFNNEVDEYITINNASKKERQPKTRMKKFR